MGSENGRNFAHAKSSTEGEDIMKLLLVYLAPFIISTGGAEKVCCDMANAMVERGHDVSILYCYGKVGMPFFPLNNKVRLCNLMSLHPEKWKGQLEPKLPQIQKIIREALRVFSISQAHGWEENYFGNLMKSDLQEMLQREQPDLIICNWPKEANYLINYTKTKIPVITRFHFGAQILAKNSSPGSKKACCKSRCISVLLHGDLGYLKKYIPNARSVVIPNVVPQYQQKTALLSQKKEIYTIINIARLDKHSKRQHLLIESFAKLAMKYPKWRVELWGEDWDKRYKKELVNLVSKYHLENRVFFRGVTHDVLGKNLQADIFAWPSAYEGFGLAMAEAMSAGLPVVAFHSCQAAREIVGKDCGILVSDGASAFSEGLEELMKNREMRVRMGVNAKESMKQYAADKIWQKWEEMIQG